MRWIYLLRDPRDYRPRYVGCSRDVDRRLLWHMSGARTGRDRCPKARWLRRLIKLGLEPILDAVERVGHKVDHVGRERQWIEHLLASGEKILNVSNGGVKRRAANVRVSAIERAARKLRDRRTVERAVDEFSGDRSGALPLHSDGHRGEVCPQHGWQGAQPCACSAAPALDVPTPSQLNRFGHYRDAAGRWRTPRGAKPRGRVPVQKPLR